MYANSRVEFENLLFFTTGFFYSALSVDDRKGQKRGTVEFCFLPFIFFGIFFRQLIMLQKLMSDDIDIVI